MAYRMSLTTRVMIVAIGVAQCFGCYSLWKAWCVQKRGEIQGNTYSTLAHCDENADRPKPVRERKDVWRNDGWYLNRCDLPDSLIPLSKDGDAVFNDIIIRSCATIECRNYGEENKVIPGKAINFCGKLWLCNNHTIPQADSFTITFVRDPVEHGVSGNVTIPISKRLLWRWPERDLCVIHAESLPFGRNLMKYFLDRELGFNCVFDGWYLGVGRDGRGFHRRVSGIRRHCTTYPELKIDVDCWRGTCELATQNGDCGAVLCTTTSFGRFISGIHIWGALS